MMELTSKPAAMLEPSPQPTSTAPSVRGGGRGQAPEESSPLPSPPASNPQPSAKEVESLRPLTSPPKSATRVTRVTRA